MIRRPPPKVSAPHLVADWIELACCVSESGEAAGTLLVEAREEALESAGKIRTSDKTDEFQSEAEDVWLHLRARAESFGDRYPFEVSDDTTGITTRPLTPARTVYSFLLCAANLNAVTKQEQSMLTTSFERLSKHALRGLVPPSWSVEVFGTSAKTGERYSQPKLQDRMVELADRVGGELTGAARDVDEANHGDGGLDLVAHPATLDPLSHLPLYLGQCACGDGWQAKQQEVMPSAWDQRLVSGSAIVPVLFIPYSYRDQSAGWVSRWGLKTVALVDRDRFLELLDAAEQGVLDEAVDEAPTEWLAETLVGFRAAEPVA